MFSVALKGNRKPSKAYVMRTIGVCIEAGHTHFELSWGENWIELIQQRLNGLWCGHGWIKELGGDDIAQELNKMQREGK